MHKLQAEESLTLLHGKTHRAAMVI